jgi:hypothetical protein
MIRSFDFGLIVFAILFAAGCATSTKTPDQVSPYVDSDLPELPLLSPTTRETSSARPSMTSTMATKRTPNSTTAQTWTPLPTLSTEEAISHVTQLLTDNAGCALPCWWSIVPGATSKMEVVQFLDSFVMESWKNKAEISEQGDVIFSYGAAYSVNPGSESARNTYDEIYGVSNLGSIGLEIRNDVVDAISIAPFGNEISYQLHQLLSDFGKPDQVYISTYSSSPDGVLPFNLVLHFVDDGILAYFYDWSAEMKSNSIVWCPSSIGPELFLWSPDDKNLNFDEIQQLTVNADSTSPLRELKEVSDFDIDVFFETFRMQGDGRCLITSAELWP